MNALMIVKALLLLVFLGLCFAWFTQMLRALPKGRAAWRRVSPGRIGVLALAVGLLIWALERLS